MTKFVLDAIMWLSEALAGTILILLSSVLWRRWRRRATASYLQERRERGLELLLASSRFETISGLQLLARFGGGPLSPALLARLAELTYSPDSTVSSLALKVLRDCAADARLRATGIREGDVAVERHTGTG